MVCGVFIAPVLRPGFQTAQACDVELALPRRAAAGEVAPAAIVASFAAFLSSARLAAGTFSGARQLWVFCTSEGAVPVSCTVVLNVWSSQE